MCRDTPRSTPRFARFGAVAVPAATVNRVVNTLLEKGRIPRGYLGVGLQTIHLPESLRQLLQGEQKSAAIVLEVEPDGLVFDADSVQAERITEDADYEGERVTFTARLDRARIPI